MQPQHGDQQRCLARTGSCEHEKMAFQLLAQGLKPAKTGDRHAPEKDIAGPVDQAELVEHGGKTGCGPFARAPFRVDIGPERQPGAREGPPGQPKPSVIGRRVPKTCGARQDAIDDQGDRRERERAAHDDDQGANNGNAESVPGPK